MKKAIVLSLLIAIINVSYAKSDSISISYLQRELNSRPASVPLEKALQLLFHEGSVDTFSVHGIAYIDGFYYPFAKVKGKTEFQQIYHLQQWKTGDRFTMVQPDNFFTIFLGVLFAIHFFLLLFGTFIDYFEVRSDAKYSKNIVNIMARYEEGIELLRCREAAFTIFALTITALVAICSSSFSLPTVQIMGWFVVSGILNFQIRRWVVKSTIHSIEQALVKAK